MALRRQQAQEENEQRQLQNLMLNANMVNQHCLQKNATHLQTKKRSPEPLALAQQQQLAIQQQQQQLDSSNSNQSPENLSENNGSCNQAAALGIVPNNSTCPNSPSSKSPNQAGVSGNGLLLSGEGIPNEEQQVAEETRKRRRQENIENNLEKNGKFWQFLDKKCGN